MSGIVRGPEHRVHNEIIRLLLGLRALALKTRHELGELAGQVQYRTRPPS